jgi:glycosyltransferase involved in cell wall biosynthesis
MPTSATGRPTHDRTLSVVIPAWNAVATIEGCLRSVLASDDPSLEVVVVDDGSTDATRDIVADIFARDPRGSLVVLASNAGPAAARNAGAQHARGAYLLFLDSDTMVLPDTLTRFAQSVTADRAVVGIYDAEPLTPGWTARYKAYLNHHLFSRDGTVAYETFPGGIGGMNADAFRAVGGFDESIKWGMDYECEAFGDRLRAAGHTLVLDPSIRVRHRFPGFARATRTYFSRVSIFMERFGDHGFESSGTASRRIGMATTAASLAVVLLPACLVVRPLRVVVAMLLGCYLGGYGSSLAFVARRDPWFLPVAVVLNLYFNTVISFGAAYGVARRLLLPRIARRATDVPRCESRSLPWRSPALGSVEGSTRHSP